MKMNTSPLLRVLLILALFTSLGLEEAIAQPAEKGAGSTPSLTVDDAVAKALKASEDVAIAESELRRAEAQIREARGRILPQISASATSTRYLETPVIQFGDSQIPIKEDWELGMGVQVTQAVWAFGRITQAIDIAKLTRSLREDSIENARLEITKQVRTAYFATQLAEKILEAVEQSLGNARRSQSILQNKFQRGRIPRFDNIKMSADIASRTPLVADAQRQLELAWLQLSLLIGEEATTRYNLATPMTDQFPALQEDVLVAKAFETHPGLRAAARSVEVSEKYKKLARSEHYPVLSAFGNYDRNGTSDQFYPPEDRLNDTFAVGLNLTIPIFSGGSTQARVRQAAEDERQAVLNQRKLTESITLGLRNALASYRTNVEKYKAAVTSESLARQTFQLAQNQFSAGRLTLKDLNDFELALTNSKIQMASSLFEIHRSLAEIRSFTGEEGAVQ